MLKTLVYAALGIFLFVRTLSKVLANRKQAYSRLSEPEEAETFAVPDDIDNAEQDFFADTTSPAEDAAMPQAEQPVQPAPEAAETPDTPTPDADFTNPDNARQAFIASEIFNRKY